MNINESHTRTGGKQRGQGMVEFVVAAAFFTVPLLIGLTYLARVADSRQHLYQAARYAAWERTVWYRSGDEYVTKSDLELAREIGRRIFAPSDTGIDTNHDQAMVSTESAVLDPFLYTADFTQGKQLPMFRRANRQQAAAMVGYSKSNPGSLIAGAVNTVAKLGLRLDPDGVATSSVTVEMATIPLLNGFGSGSANSEAHNALLGGAWNASGPSGVIAHIRPLVPTGYLNNVPGFNALRVLAGVLFPEIGPDSLDLGHVDPDKVACQRIAGMPGNDRDC